MDRKRWYLGVGAASLVAAGFVMAVVVDQPGATAAADASHESEPSPQIPDTIKVVDRNTGETVGHMTSKGVAEANTLELPPGARQERRPTPVHDDEGRLVGHFYPEIGFVSLEETSAPGFDATALRSAAPTTTVVAVPTPGR